MKGLNHDQEIGAGDGAGDVRMAEQMQINLIHLTK